MAKNAYHINDVCLLLDKAKAEEAAVNLKAWTSDGRVIDYSGWLVKGGSWRGGFHRLVNPANGEVRTVPDIYIFSFLGKPVFL